MRTKYALLASVTTKNGTLLANCWNSYTKTHPLQKFFAEKVGLPKKIYLHAEIRAMVIASIQPHGPLHTLSVRRFGKNKEMLDAKPCPICIEAAIFFGIKKIDYTTKNGWVYGKTPQELKDDYKQASK